MRRVTKHQTISAYPFCVAFENSIATDYVTEKIYDCLLAGTVPIYLGTRDVAEFVLEGSYIDATAYGGPRGLAAYLHHLPERLDEYGAYLAWRDKPLPARLVAMTESVSVDHFLRLLDRLPPHPDGPHPTVSLSANAIMSGPSDKGEGTSPAIATGEADFPMPEHLRDSDILGSLRDRLVRLLLFTTRLSPVGVRVAKGTIVAAVWLVGLFFLGAGRSTPLLAAAAAFAWLAGHAGYSMWVP